MVNLIPLLTLLATGLTVCNLKPTNMVLKGFKQREQRPLVKFSIKAHLGEIEDFLDVLVIDMDSAYNKLPRRL